MRTLFICAALAVAASAPAFAESLSASDNAAVVNYADLNLSEAHDRAILNERVNAAVREVCHQLRRGNHDPIDTCQRDLRQEVIKQTQGLARRALLTADAAPADDRMR